MREPLSVALLALAVLAGTPGLGHAQMRSTETTTGDSVTQRYQSALLTLRDSVARVRTDIDRFRRDLQGAGARTVENRARRLQASCRALGGTLVATEADVRVSQATAAAADQLRTAERRLVQQMRSSRLLLQELCERGLAPNGPGEWSDSLKAWGPHRTSRLEQSLTALQGAYARFAGAAGIKLEPRLPAH